MEMKLRFAARESWFAAGMCPLMSEMNGRHLYTCSMQSANRCFPLSTNSARLQLWCTALRNLHEDFCLNVELKLSACKVIFLRFSTHILHWKTACNTHPIFSIKIQNVLHTVSKYNFSSTNLRFKLQNKNE